MLTGAEFDALVADISKHGLREPIVLHEGMILDGRTRWRACERLGIKASTIEWDRLGSPEAFVVSKNIMRRHLTASQRAWLISEFTTLRIGQTKATSTTAKAKDQAVVLTTREAASIAGVGAAVVQAAKSVREHGTPEQKETIASGKAGARKVAKNMNDPKRVEMKHALRIQNQRIRAEIWRHLRDALVALTSLPKPSDVVMTLRQPKQEPFVNQRLDKSLNWLKEFRDDWYANGRDHQDV